MLSYTNSGDTRPNYHLMIGDSGFVQVKYPVGERSEYMSSQILYLTDAFAVWDSGVALPEMLQLLLDWDNDYFINFCLPYDWRAKRADFVGEPVSQPLHCKPSTVALLRTDIRFNKNKRD